MDAQACPPGTDREAAHLCRATCSWTPRLAMAGSGRLRSVSDKAQQLASPAGHNHQAVEGSSGAVAEKMFSLIRITVCINANATTSVSAHYQPQEWLSGAGRAGGL